MPPTKQTNPELLRGETYSGFASVRGAREHNLKNIDVSNVF
jgi:hypothetical protein